MQWTERGAAVPSRRAVSLTSSSVGRTRGDLGALEQVSRLLCKLQDPPLSYLPWHKLSVNG